MSIECSSFVMFMFLYVELVPIEMTNSHARMGCSSRDRDIGGGVAVLCIWFGGATRSLR